MKKLKICVMNGEGMDLDLKTLGYGTQQENFSGFKK
jgi:hypothetical protein